jgi:hypothetical protein
MAAKSSFSRNLVISLFNLTDMWLRRVAPRVWHGYCLTFHQARGERKVYVDAEEVLADVMLQETYLNGL